MRKANSPAAGGWLLVFVLILAAWGVKESQSGLAAPETPSSTPSASLSPTNSPSPSSTPSQSPTNSPSPSSTPSASPSASPSTSPSQSPTNSPSPSSTPSQSPTNSPSPSSTPSASPSASASPSLAVTPSVSPTPYPACSTARLTRKILNFNKHVRDWLFNNIPKKPRHSKGLSDRLSLDVCKQVVLNVPVASGLSDRRTWATDPTYVRQRFSVKNVPCPVVASYVELNYTVVDPAKAINFWAEQNLDLSEVTHFGSGAWDLAGSATNVGFMAALVKIVNDESNCPPINLPSYYSKRQIEEPLDPLELLEA